MLRNTIVRLQDKIQMDKIQTDKIQTDKIQTAKLLESTNWAKTDKFNFLVPPAIFPSVFCPSAFCPGAHCNIKVTVVLLQPVFSKSKDRMQKSADFFTIA